MSGRSPAADFPVSSSPHTIPGTQGRDDQVEKWFNARATVTVGVLIVAVLAVVWGRNQFGGENEDLRLNGRVVITEPANIAGTGDACAGTAGLAVLTEGTAIVITPSGKPPVETTLEPGTVTADGACEIAFTATVADAMSYRFTVAGLSDLTRDHYLIDTRGDSGNMELVPILRWD
jgi:hypothetical protein